MLEEVDFKKEAANIEAFRRYLEAMGLTRQATAPKVYYQCSSRRFLTMQRLYGVPLTDLDSISSLVASPETSLITALNVWWVTSYFATVSWLLIVLLIYIEVLELFFWIKYSAGLAVCLLVKLSMQMYMQAICGYYGMAALGFLILV